MTIDGVKYKCIFKPIRYSGGERKCFICQEKIINCKGFYSFYNIFPNVLYEHRYYVCNNCVKTPEKAEKVIIPLLKILYGGKLRIDRYYIDNLNGVTYEYKSFWY